MTVTGDNWLTINLGALCPELDPNNPGSISSLIRDKANSSTADLQATLNAVNKSLMKASDLINNVRVASNAIKVAQASLTDLINNAANTGIYTKFLGICPDYPNSLLKGNADVISAISTAINNKADPCAPTFTGNTAYVGGFLLLAGAPSPNALWQQLKLLAQIFPILESVVQQGEVALASVTDGAQSLFDFFGDTADEFADFQDQFQQFQDDVPDSVALATGTSCADWICSNLKQLIPSLDPSLSGSPLNLAMQYEKDAVSSVTGAMDRVAALNTTINKAIASIQEIQGIINTAENAIVNFGAQLAATGVYFHCIGRDLSIVNSQMFIDACSAAINDTSDPSRPTFRGNTACMAGLMMVVGGPNASGLEASIKSVGKVFNAFGDKYDQLNTSLADIATNAKAFGEDLVPLGPSTATTTAAQRSANSQPNVIVNQVPQYSLVNGQLVASIAPISYTVVDPTTATPTADGSGTPPGQVTPLYGETNVPNGAPVPATNGETCDIAIPASPIVRTTSQIGENIREARRRVSDLNSI